MENNNGEYQFNGYSVFFPSGRKPFAAQKAIISKVLQALKEKKNALLESPTGTGKTLALLASSLAYQRHQYLKIPVKDVKAEASTAKTETKPKVKSEVKPDADPSADSTSTKTPTVYYCTRTHSQLAQVVDELKHCNNVYQEHLRMCVIGSRQHLCINRRAKAKAEKEKISLDEVCSEFLDVKDLQSENAGCKFGLNKKRITKTVESLRAMKIWDIEDAYKAGDAHKGCPYYSTREIFESANYILSPYNYIIDPDIREIMKINLKDSIVIFDEAHNIEDITREAASFEINRSQLVIIETEIRNVYEFTKYLMLRDLGQLVLNLIQWIDEMSENLTNNRNTTFTPKKTPSKYFNNKKTEESYFGKSENIWVGDEFVAIFEERYCINLPTIEMYQLCLEEIVKQNEENEGIENRFQGMNGNPSIPLQYEAEGEKDENSQKKLKLQISTFAISTIRRYLRVFKYMLTKDKANAMDYRICLQKKEDESGYSKKRKSINAAPATELTFNIWCLSGAVVFQEIAEACHSVLLSSGTLSPLDSFAGELKTAFPIRVEASHVINLSKQLKVALVSTFNDYSLISKYDAQQSDAYLDTLGAALLLITKQTPGGVLMFLPSYSLLYRCETRWNQTKLLRKIEIDTGANIYFEPKDTKEMKKLLIQYYEDLNSINSKAIMIGVCRGKVSEGINFSDHYARAVIVVGIPYPSIVDLKILLKREYQDILCAKDIEKTTSSSTSTPYSTKTNNGPYGSAAPSSNYKSGNSTAVTSTIHCNGSLWYKQQAFRAINQAVGRCIRHKDDFGAIILLDPRFQQEEVKTSLSRWMRDEAVEYERLEDFTLHLKHFFQPFNSYERLIAAKSHPEDIVKNEVKIEFDDNVLNQDGSNSATEMEDDHIGKNSFFDIDRNSHKDKENCVSSEKFEPNVRNDCSGDHSDFENDNPSKQFKEISISQTFQDIMDKKRLSTDREDIMKKYSPIVEGIHEKVYSPVVDPYPDNSDRMAVDENQDRSSPFTIKSKVFDFPDIISSNQYHSESCKEVQTPVASKYSSAREVDDEVAAGKEKKGKSSSKGKKKRRTNEEAEIPRVNDFKLSLSFINEIKRSFLFFQNQSTVPTYLNTNDIINVLTLNSVSSKVSSSSLSSLLKFLFPLPAHLNFLKLAFLHGLFIRRVYIGEKFETIVFPVLVESDKNGLNRHNIPFAALSVNDIQFSEDLSRLPLSHNEEVRCVDYWCREDEVVYRFICYSNIKVAESNDPVKDERDVTTHCQVLFAKILATTASSILRQSESYGNPKLLYLLQKDHEKESKDERVEDVLSDLSDGVVTNRCNPRNVSSKETLSLKQTFNSSHSKLNRKIPIIINIEET